MLNFKELPPTGNEFELLIRELLFSKGLRVYWSGIGPDGGVDLLCIEEPKSEFMSKERRWVIQCKHTAHSNRAVGNINMAAISNSCSSHQATGYLLVCSTRPSSTVVNLLKNISADTSNNISAMHWDSVDIERMLSTPHTWPIAQRFFPISANAEGWRIYATEQPNHWVVNYKGYYFHLFNRIGSQSTLHLESIRRRIEELESIEKPPNHMLRPRAVYYDDKNGNYCIYIDYHYPTDEYPKFYPYMIREILGDGEVKEGQFYRFDVRIYSYSRGSDHYDPDHYDYYQPYLWEFQVGSGREKGYVIQLPNNKEVWIDEDAPGLIDDEYLVHTDFDFRTNVNKGFHRLVVIFSNLGFIGNVKSINPNIEHIGKFYSQLDFSDLMSITSYDFYGEYFFTAQITFTCCDFDKLEVLLREFPMSIEMTFVLRKHYILKREEEFGQKDELYDITFSILPSNPLDNNVVCKVLNEYFMDLAEIISSQLSKEYCADNNVIT